MKVNKFLIITFAIVGLLIIMLFQYSYSFRNSRALILVPEKTLQSSAPSDSVETFERNIEGEIKAQGM